ELREVARLEVAAPHDAARRGRRARRGAARARLGDARPVVQVVAEDGDAQAARVDGGERIGLRGPGGAVPAAVDLGVRVAVQRGVEDEVVELDVAQVPGDGGSRDGAHRAQI